MYKKLKEIKKDQGITLLYSVLLISLLSIILASVFFLIFNSLKISFSGKDSQLAYYAAEAGADCAFYWDHEKSMFGRDTGWTSKNGASSPVALDQTGHPSTNLFYDSSSDPHTWFGLNCFISDVITPLYFKSNANPYLDYVEFSFTAEFPDTNQCAKVVIEKTKNDPYITTIRSRGYNSCNSSGEPTSGAVERGLEMIYGEIY